MPTYRDWLRRVARFHGSIRRLHGLRVSYLRQYTFAPLVLAIPTLSVLGGVLGALSGQVLFLGVWLLTTVAWLSLTLRLRHPDQAGRQDGRRNRWWPRYSLAVRFGLAVCFSSFLVISTLPFLENVTTPRNLFIIDLTLESVAYIWIVSAIYNFGIGYVAALLRITGHVTRQRRAAGTARGVSIPSRLERARKAHVYLVMLLSGSGIALWMGSHGGFVEVGYVLFLVLPAMCFRTPWNRDGRWSLLDFAPHFQAIALYAGALAHFIRRASELIGPTGPRQDDPSWVILVELPRALFSSVMGTPQALETVMTTFLVLCGVRVINTLRRNIVTVYEGHTAAALSINSDAENYVDVDGYVRQLLNFVRSADGGVVGVTGVRGVGKTALLNRVVASLKDRYAVVWMTAPAGRQEGLAFLMSVARTICRRAMDDVSPALFGGYSGWQKALGEFYRRSIGPLVVLVLVVAAVWVGPDWSRVGVRVDYERRPMVPLPARVRVAGNVVDGTRLGCANYGLAHVVSAEKGVVRVLKQRIAKYVSTGTNQGLRPPGKGWLVVPAIDERGFELIGVASTEFSGDVLKKRREWFSPSYLAGDRPDTHSDFQDAYYAVVLHDDRGAVSSDESPHMVRCLDVLRGHPALDGHLADLTARVRDLVKSNVPMISGAEIPTMVLFGSFVEGGRSGTKDGCCVLNGEQLGRLREILVRYEGLLNRDSLAEVSESRSRVLTASVEGRSVTWVRDLVSFGAAILVLLLAGAMWRFGNFLVRAPFNLRLLTLARESEEFLEFLDYSTGREMSSALSLQGLSFGAKRTLKSRAVTLQSLTERYREYVATLCKSYNGKLLVVVDELDKVRDPQHVREILLELKGALFQEGCFYLISISEDVARAFRGRMSEGRDIVESSFDDIVTIRRMEVKTAQEMIQRRLRSHDNLPRIDDGALELMSAFVGGIPREIVRGLRDLIISGGASGDVTVQKVGRDFMRSEVERWWSHLVEVPTRAENIGKLRANCKVILGNLEAAVEGEPWPKAVAGLLKNNLEILDPNGVRGEIDIVRDREQVAQTAGGGDGDHGRRSLEEVRWRLRLLGEVQTCIRLSVVNSVMERAWEAGTEDVWRPVLPNVVECIELVMQQPVLAETHLFDIQERIARSQGRR